MRSLTSLSCVIFIRDQHAIDRHVAGVLFFLLSTSHVVRRARATEGKTNRTRSPHVLIERLALVAAAVLFSSALVFLFLPFFAFFSFFCALVIESRTRTNVCGYTFYSFFLLLWIIADIHRTRRTRESFLFPFFGRQDEEKHRLVLARPSPFCSILQRHTDIKTSHPRWCFAVGKRRQSCLRAYLSAS